MTGIIDVHLHAQPTHLLRETARATMEREWGEAAGILATADSLVAHLDRCGVERACLINYVAPEVMGYTAAVNDWVATYARDHRDRLVPFGSLHPLHVEDCRREAERLVSTLELGGIKIHGPHQLLAPNAYATDPRFAGLRDLYEVAETAGVPVMFHTGTSVFPGARVRYGDPLAADDVAVDFPRLKILLAHGGRPLWCDVAFFLARRHPNVYLDISSIPPARVLHYFPRLPELPGKFLFGSDWPGPGVPSIGDTLAALKSLPLSPDALARLLGGNAATLIARL